MVALINRLRFGFGRRLHMNQPATYGRDVDDGAKVSFDQKHNIMPKVKNTVTSKKDIIF